MRYRIFIISVCFLFIIGGPVSESAPAPASSEESCVDCPGDTNSYAGGSVGLCPLIFTNPHYINEYMSYFLKDSQGWASYGFIAGYTHGALLSGDSFDICRFWNGLSIDPPEDAADGSWTEVKLVVRNIDYSGPWPVLTISESGLGSWQFEGRYAPTVEIDIPPGTTLDFSWSAAPGDHGANIEGYRYGWDLTDFYDPYEWNTTFGAGYQSTTKTYYSGVHLLCVEAVDASGAFSLGSIKVSIVPEAAEIGTRIAPGSRIIDYGGACLIDEICTFRVNVDNSVSSRQSTWGKIKRIYK